MNSNKLPYIVGKRNEPTISFSQSVYTNMCLLVRNSSEHFRKDFRNACYVQYTLQISAFEWDKYARKKKFNDEIKTYFTLFLRIFIRFRLRIYRVVDNVPLEGQRLFDIKGYSSHTYFESLPFPELRFIYSILDSMQIQFIKVCLMLH